MDAPQSCLWRPVVVYTIWTFIVHRQTFQTVVSSPPPAGQLPEGDKVDTVCSKAKASAREGFLKAIKSVGCN